VHSKRTILFRSPEPLEKQDLENELDRYKKRILKDREIVSIFILN